MYKLFTLVLCIKTQFQTIYYCFSNMNHVIRLCSYSTLPLDEEAEIIDDDGSIESDESDSAANVCHFHSFDYSTLLHKVLFCMWKLL